MQLPNKTFTTLFFVAIIAAIITFFLSKRKNA